MTNKFQSQKKLKFTETSFCSRNMIPSQKQNTVTKKFRHRNKLQSQKKLSFTEATFCSRNKTCPHACLFKLNVLQNLFLLFLSQHHLYCHHAFFSEQRDITWPDKSFSFIETFFMVVLCVTIILFFSPQYCSMKKSHKLGLHI